MSEFVKCVVGGLAATSPIWGACLIYAAVRIIKAVRLERRAWRDACDDAAAYMNERKERRA